MPQPYQLLLSTVTVIDAMLTVHVTVVTYVFRFSSIRYSLNKLLRKTKEVYKQLIVLYSISKR